MEDPRTYARHGTTPPRQDPNGQDRNTLRAGTIRINPHEVHLADPALYDAVYQPSTAARRVEKWVFAANMFGPNESVFGVTAHSRHRDLRAALNPAFARRAVVAAWEPLLRRKVALALAWLRGARDGGSVANVSDLCWAFAGDMIAELAAGQSFRLLGDPAAAAESGGRRGRGRWRRGPSTSSFRGL